MRLPRGLVLAPVILVAGLTMLVGIHAIVGFEPFAHYFDEHVKTPDAATVSVLYRRYAMLGYPLGVAIIAAAVGIVWKREASAEAVSWFLCLSILTLASWLFWQHCAVRAIYEFVTMPL